MLPRVEYSLTEQRISLESILWTQCGHEESSINRRLGRNKIVS